MTSTDPPVTTREKLDHLLSEMQAAQYCLEAERLDDAIGILVGALIAIGAIRSRYRMLSIPNGGDHEGD